ncbi:uncharacterized protein LOC108734217 [Agrilus planipennis]|uniref:Uncharacterized protein LOC108734217 n=1 Tax=Agrilus planipennis TaxID=224129 RepID=A0A1W4WL38_AGRPL|nr:uncharacterized protein LOC108734217 [Agrilus planipennis]
MFLAKTIVNILVFQNIFAHGNLLLYSSRKVEIPALESIQRDDLQFYLEKNKLDKPKLVTFNYETLNENVLNAFKSKYSCYVPNANINFENATVLLGNADQDKITIKRSLLPFQHDENVVIVLSPLKRRPKRAINISTELPTTVPKYTTADTTTGNVPTGPVLFGASFKDVQTMIYSSKPPLLYIDSTSLSLGNPKSSSIDSRDSYVRLIVTIQVNDGPEKVVLRFRFPWLNGYWSLTSVDVEKDTKTYNLSILNDVNAPRRFSYHCGGETVFKNEEAKLILYEIQAQPDAQDNKFSDAYNCVPFTTIPIWSGLFVTFILIIGLIIGLDALGSIKTMDKFDNYKTKQLSITVAE